MDMIDLLSIWDICRHICQWHICCETMHSGTLLQVVCIVTHSCFCDDRKEGLFGKGERFLLKSAWHVRWAVHWTKMTYIQFSFGWWGMYPLELPWCKKTVFLASLVEYAFYWVVGSVVSYTSGRDKDLNIPMIRDYACPCVRISEFMYARSYDQVTTHFSRSKSNFFFVDSKNAIRPIWPGLGIRMQILIFYFAVCIFDIWVRNAA